MTFAQASASLRQPDRFDSISPAETAIVQSAVGQRQQSQRIPAMLSENGNQLNPTAQSET